MNINIIFNDKLMDIFSLSFEELIIGELSPKMCQESWLGKINGVDIFLILIENEWF